jgi:hypothetical protein
MLKSLALAGVFLFASAVSTIAVTSTATPKKVTSPSSAPTAPQPQGFCMPPGAKC